ncbi:alpha-amylase-like [Anticarsia gemmatalis]|uniref:alpha-amylase-like n=1 Tax=Anticarsia gemmatalis TaxID=129554 RepID=UPI003F75EA69
MKVLIPSLYLLLCGVVYCFRDYQHHKRTNLLANRTVIVQLFEWKWLDIADECERFLGPKRYGGVQTSPPSENVVINLADVGRPWYERYQVMSYKIQTRSGSEADFLNMTTRCNKRGVRIYADVVINHMTGNGALNIGTAGSTAEFEQYDYPDVPYKREHFNQPECDMNNLDNATEVRVCQLVGLKDLNQTEPYVRQKIVDYLNKLISLGVAGFRVDAAKHMWPEDLEAIFDSVNDLNTTFGFQPHSRPYIYQEVSRGGVVTPFNYTSIGDVTEFTSVSVLYAVFTDQKALSSLRSWGSASWSMLPSSHALVFTDNHDTQRSSGSLNYKYGARYQAAVAFLLAHRYGQPRFTSSYDFTRNDQGPPSDGRGHIYSPIITKNGSCSGGYICEHRWDTIRRMVTFRNVVHGTKVQRWWDNGTDQIAFSRGGKGFIVFNIGSSILENTFDTGLPPGTYCDIKTGETNWEECTGKSVTVSSDGQADIRLNGRLGDLYLAIHVGRESKIEVL